MPEKAAMPFFAPSPVAARRLETIWLPVGSEYSPDLDSPENKSAYRRRQAYIARLAFANPTEDR
jgi:hypothetical protein